MQIKTRETTYESHPLDDEEYVKIDLSCRATSNLDPNPKFGIEDETLLWILRKRQEGFEIHLR